MLAHLPQQRFSVRNGDVVEPYVIFTNPHDGSGKAYCYPTTERVVCANTYRISQGERTKGIGIRHTGNVRTKIQDAQAALGIAVQGFEEFKEAAEQMARTPFEIRHYANDVLDAVLDVTEAQAKLGADVLAATLDVTEAGLELARKEFSKKIERRAGVLDDILGIYESERCEPKGTLWASWNAVTESADHRKPGRQSKDAELRASRRFESVLVGDADELKQAAYTQAVAIMRG